MPRIGNPSEAISDSWKYALTGSLVSIPFTVASYWQTGSEMSLSAVLLGGFLAGYLSKRNTGESAGVGVRTGLVGGLPVVWMLFDLLAATSGLSGPSWFVAAGTAMVLGATVVIAVVSFGLSAALGAVGASVGNRLAGFGDRRGPSTISR